MPSLPPIRKKKSFNGGRSYHGNHGRHIVATREGMANTLDQYVASWVEEASTASREQRPRHPRPPPPLLHRTDSCFLTPNRSGVIWTMPSPRKLQDVAETLLRDFRRQQALAARQRLMCRCLVAGLRTRLGNQRQGALAEAMDRHWGGARESLEWIRGNPEEAHRRIQDLLWSLAMERPEGGRMDEWWYR